MKTDLMLSEVELVTANTLTDRRNKKKLYLQPIIIARLD